MGTREKTNSLSGSDWRAAGVFVSALPSPSFLKCFLLWLQDALGPPALPASACPPSRGLTSPPSVWILTPRTVSSTPAPPLLHSHSLSEPLYAWCSAEPELCAEATWGPGALCCSTSSPGSVPQRSRSLLELRLAGVWEGKRRGGLQREESEPVWRGVWRRERTSHFVQNRVLCITLVTSLAPTPLFDPRRTKWPCEFYYYYIRCLCHSLGLFWIEHWRNSFWLRNLQKVSMAHR